MGGVDPSTKELITGLSDMTNLSDREAEVVAHITEAADRYDTDKEVREYVANELELKPSTVDTYYRRALEKFKRAAETKEYMENNLSLEGVADDE